MTQLFYYDGVFSASEPPCKITSPVNNILIPAEHEIVEHDLEDTRDESKVVTDLIIDRDDHNLAESQSFSPNSPKGKNSDTAEDESEDEVILFTGRHSTIIDNDNLRFVVLNYYENKSDNQLNRSLSYFLVQPPQKNLHLV